MFQSSLTALLLLLLNVQGFQIKVGPTKTVLKAYKLNELEEVKQSGLFMYRALIFPY